MAHVRSKRRSKQRSQNQMKWILASITGAVVTIIAVLAIASRQNNAPSQKEFDANFEPEVTGGPRVQVVQDDVIDYGDVKLGTTVTTVYNVRNVGDEPLVVLGEPRVELVEGC